jgi:hypothetical protein
MPPKGLEIKPRLIIFGDVQLAERVSELPKYQFVIMEGYGMLVQAR